MVHDGFVLWPNISEFKCEINGTRHDVEELMDLFMTPRQTLKAQSQASTLFFVNRTN